MKAYSTRDKAYKAAGKKSLFANLNGKFSQFDVIDVDGQFHVVQTGQYPKQDFTILYQFSAGYSERVA